MTDASASSVGPDYAKEPQPSPTAKRTLQQCSVCLLVKHAVVSERCGEAGCDGVMGPWRHDTETSTPRIALVDGDTTTPLSAEALVVAMFALVPDAAKGKVIDVAVAVQLQLDQGQAIGLQRHRVVRPDGNGIVGP